MSRSNCLFLLSVLIASPLLAEDWPQYRGPNRDDRSAETGLLTEWPADGPRLLWTYADTGVGLAGPAIVGERLYTLGGRGEQEFLIALDLKAVTDGTVAEAWAISVGALFDFSSNNWTSGPSATPTVDGDAIYALGGNGDLVCVDKGGQERWRKNLPNDLAAEVNPIGGGPRKLGWGFTWSPLVDGDQLVCVPGGPQGTVAALNKETGAVLWRSTELTDQAAYTSPMVADIGGVRQYVVLTNQGVYGVAAKDGRLLWKYLRTPRYGTEVVNSPIVHGNKVYVTVGAGAGCDLLQIQHDGDAFEAELVYANKNMANHHGNVVLLNNHIYGFGQGRGWLCQDVATGEIVWMDRRGLRSGSMTYADGHFYCYTEDDGTVALVVASPEGWKEAGRFKIPQTSTKRKPRGGIWTPPVVSGGRLFLRDQELLFCYDVSASRERQ